MWHVMSSPLIQIRATLPPGLAIRECWAIVVLFYCMLFNFLVLLEYPLVNFGMRMHAELKQMEKETNTVSVEEVSPRWVGWSVFGDEKAYMRQAAKFRSLDQTCRWLFPLLFIILFFTVLIPVYNAGPFEG